MKLSKLVDDKLNTHIQNNLQLRGYRHGWLLRTLHSNHAWWLLVVAAVLLMVAAGIEWSMNPQFGTIYTGDDADMVRTWMYAIMAVQAAVTAFIIPISFSLISALQDGHGARPVQNHMFMFETTLVPLSVSGMALLLGAGIASALSVGFELMMLSSFMLLCIWFTANIAWTVYYLFKALGFTTSRVLTDVQRSYIVNHAWPQTMRGQLSQSIWQATVSGDEGGYKKFSEAISKLSYVRLIDYFMGERRALYEQNFMRTKRLVDVDLSCLKLYLKRLDDVRSNIVVSGRNDAPSSAQKLNVWPEPSFNFDYQGERTLVYMSDSHEIPKHIQRELNSIGARAFLFKRPSLAPDLHDFISDASQSLKQAIVNSEKELTKSKLDDFFNVMSFVIRISINEDGNSMFPDRGLGYYSEDFLSGMWQEYKIIAELLAVKVNAGWQAEGETLFSHAFGFAHDFVGSDKVVKDVEAVWQVLKLFDACHAGMMEQGVSNSFMERVYKTIFPSLSYFSYDYTSSLSLDDKALSKNLISVSKYLDLIILLLDRSIRVNNSHSVNLLTDLIDENVRVWGYRLGARFGWEMESCLVTIFDANLFSEHRDQPRHHISLIRAAVDNHWVDSVYKLLSKWIFRSWPPKKDSALPSDERKRDLRSLLFGSSLRKGERLVDFINEEEIGSSLLRQSIIPRAQGLNDYQRHQRIDNTGLYLEVFENNHPMNHIQSHSVPSGSIYDAFNYGYAVLYLLAAREGMNVLPDGWADVIRNYGDPNADAAQPVISRLEKIAKILNDGSLRLYPINAARELSKDDLSEEELDVRVGYVLDAITRVREKYEQKREEEIQNGPLSTEIFRQFGSSVEQMIRSGLSGGSYALPANVKITHHKREGDDLIRYGKTVEWQRAEFLEDRRFADFRDLPEHYASELHEDLPELAREELNKHIQKGLNGEESSVSYVSKPLDFWNQLRDVIGDYQLPMLLTPSYSVSDLWYYLRTHLPTGYNFAHMNHSKHGRFANGTVMFPAVLGQSRIALPVYNGLELGSENRYILVDASAIESFNVAAIGDEHLPKLADNMRWVDGMDAAGGSIRFKLAEYTDKQDKVALYEAFHADMTFGDLKPRVWDVSSMVMTRAAE